MPKKINKNTLNLSSLSKYLSDEESAYKKLESIRWKNGITCPHCGSVDQSKFMATRNDTERKTRTGKVTYRRVWQCDVCHKQFSVLVGTIFEDSRIPVSKWLIAFYEISADKNGISSHELARKLDITQKSAWFMADRIRRAIARPPLSNKLQGTVEADETYIGGKAKNMHKSKREKVIDGHGAVGKTPVFSIVKRGGEVRSQVLDNVNSQTVKEPLIENVEKQSTLNTDTSPIYNEVGCEFSQHETVDHSSDEYVRGLAYTNTVEGYFSQLKRSINGTHHHVSNKHLERYLAEFDYRYSTRKQDDGLRTEDAIRRSSGKRLTYNTLIGK